MTEKNWEELTFSDDFMFGKVMTIPYICKGTLERILGVEIERIVYSKSQESFSTDYGAKGIRLDVYIKDGKGTIYTIEMQTINYDDLPLRSRYYQSNIDVTILDRGVKYSNLNRSFIIFVCKFDLFGEGRHIYTFENICLQNKNLHLEDKTTKIFLNTAGTLDDVSEDLKAFLDYIHTGIPTDNFVKAIDQEVAFARVNRKWREEYMQFRLYLQDAQRDGEKIKVISQIRQNYADGYPAEIYAHFLGVSIEYANTITHLIDNHPDLNDNQIYELLLTSNS